MQDDHQDHMFECVNRRCRYYGKLCKLFILNAVYFDVAARGYDCIVCGHRMRHRGKV